MGPSYGYGGYSGCGYSTPCGGTGTRGYGYALILVLFILLVIIGASRI
jgi:uncharacterized protein (TIGR01732 family)